MLRSRIGVKSWRNSVCGSRADQRELAPSECRLKMWSAAIKKASQLQQQTLQQGEDPGDDRTLHREECPLVPNSVHMLGAERNGVQLDGSDMHLWDVWIHS